MPIDREYLVSQKAALEQQKQLTMNAVYKIDGAIMLATALMDMLAQECADEDEDCDVVIDAETDAEALATAGEIVKDADPEAVADPLEAAIEEAP